MDLTLVIMAAGMGSRFGGIKQIEAVGPNNEIIIDYSVFDAKKAGFTKVVFVIKKEIEEQFREVVFDRLSKIIECSYVFQEIDDLPKGLVCPPTREKPWGTAHAVLCAKDEVNSAFAVINADDFYGYGAFKLVADYLKNLKKDSEYHYCMAGYELKNTLSEKGYVSRGVCSIDDNNNLIDIVERTHIEKENDNIVFRENENITRLNPNTIVSMNCWGFTKEIFDEIEEMFPSFYESSKANLDKAEFYLPSALENLLEENKAKVKVLKCGEMWHGFTYKEDKADVTEAIGKMISIGKYPENLWG